MWYGHGYGAWGWFFGTLMMAAFWGAVVWLVLSATRRNESSGPTRQTPEEILAERYARGEIDADEYRRRLDDLTVRPR
jgi:putative membrane protein